VLIAMAGLPGSGKSTLAACLVERLGAVVLDKDHVRAALFPPRVLDYSAVQDDIAMAAIYQAVSAIHTVNPRQTVIVDGRTFLRPGQVQSLLSMAASLGEKPQIIECICDDGVARERLERDLAQGSHSAGNRTFALYLSLKGAAEPIMLPHLVLDTGKTPLAECVWRCLEYLQGEGGNDHSPLEGQRASR
jgi:adenylylsulfate kinase